jgi:hypothetical protein
METRPDKPSIRITLDDLRDEQILRLDRSIIEELLLRLDLRGRHLVGDLDLLRAEG